MGRTAVGKVLWLCFLLGCCPGCVTVSPPPSPDKEKPEPFVAAVLKPHAVDTTAPQATQKRDVVLKAVPLRTPLAEAKAIMEGHGFRCFTGVPANNGTCLHCTTYKRNNQYTADKVVVRLYYNKNQVVDADVLVEANVERPSHGFWPL